MSGPSSCAECGRRATPSRRERVKTWLLGVAGVALLMLVLHSDSVHQTDRVRASCEDNRDLIIAVERDLAAARVERGEDELAAVSRARVRRWSRRAC